MTGSRYDRFADELFRWESLDGFILESDWRDGIHVIGKGVEQFEVLIRGGVESADDSRCLPVFFSGAVSRDGSRPPYFSGSTLARQMEMPVVAISDPTLMWSDRLTIGWYAGVSGAHTQESIARFLAELRGSIGRELVLVGGSAGGFASLYYAGRVGCGAFVWNPQTDLLRYGAWAVRDYLSVALKDEGWRATGDAALNEVDPVPLDRARSALIAGGIDSRVGPLSPISRMLYLQNDSDHHLQRHAEPYRVANEMAALGDGLYAAGESKVMAVGGFGEGHRAPRREIIEYALGLVIDPSVDLESGMRALGNTQC